MNGRVSPGWQRAALAVLAGAALSSCSETAGELIEFETLALAQVAPTAGTPSSFTTVEGWQIELTEARILVGPLYMYSGGQRASLLPALLGIGVVHAHPSDATFDRGKVLGSVITQRVVDLLSETPASFGPGPGLAGTVATLELQIHPPGFSDPDIAAPETAAMNGRSFAFTGTASKDGLSLPFVASGDLGETIPERTVDSIDASVSLDDSDTQPGAALVALHLDEWFRFIDFERLANDTTAGEEGTWDLMAHGRSTTALLRGIRSRFAYTLSWQSQ